MADEEKTLQLKLLFDNKGALSAIESGNKKFNEFKKTGQGAANDVSKGFLAMSKAVKENFVQFGAAALATFAVIKKSFDFVKEFSKFEQSAQGMENQFGVSSEEVLKQLKKVSAGTVSNSDLISAANRSMALNVTNDLGEMSKLLEYARLRARVMGIDTTQAFNDIVTGIGRGSPLILDNLGIVTKGWDAEAAAAGKAMDTQFILNKVLSSANGELKNAGPLVLTNAERIQQFETTLGSLKEEIGSLLIHAFMPLISVISKAVNFFKELPGPIKAFAVAMAIIIPLIFSIAAAVSALIPVVAALGVTANIALAGIPLAIGAIVTGVALMYQNFDKLLGLFNSLPKPIKTIIAALAPIIAFPQTLVFGIIAIIKKWDDLVASIKYGAEVASKVTENIFGGKKWDTDLDKIKSKYEQTLKDIEKKRLAEEKKETGPKGIKKGKPVAVDTEAQKKELDFLKELRDADLKTTAERIKYIDMLLKKHQGNAATVALLNKEKNKVLKEQDQAYNDFVLNETKNQILKINEQQQELLDQQKALKDQGIISEQTYQDRVLSINQSASDKRSEITQKLTEEQQSAVSALVKSFGEVAGAIDGTNTSLQTFSQQASNTLSNIASSKGWQDLLIKGIADTITYIINEFNKLNRVTELEQQMSMQRMNDVYLKAADERVRILEGEQAKQNALLAARQEQELKYFDQYSASAVANKAVQDQIEAEKVASMDATEKARYDIQKKYEDERAALLLKQEEEKKAQEATQKAQRNAAKEAQFNAQKSIQIAQARIDKESAKAQIHKEFWAPWDAGTRDSLLGQIDSMYGDIIGAIQGQAFIPEYAKGTDSLASDQLARVHQGERIIPASMNLPGISNSQLMQSAVRGMNGGNRYTTNNNQTSTSQNFGFAGANFNLQGIQNPRDFLLAMQREANAMGATLLR